MSKFFNDLIHIKGTRDEFYSALKEKILSFGLKCIEAESSNTKITFDLNNGMKWVFEDTRPEETTSADISVYITNGTTKVSTQGSNVINYIYAGNYVATTENVDRALSVFFAEDSGTYYLNVASYKRPTDTVTAIVTQLNGEPIILTDFSNMVLNGLTITRKDNTTSNTCPIGIGYMRDDMNYAILEHPIAKDSQGNYLGIIESITLSNLGKPKVKLIINGEEYLACTYNTGSYIAGILIPFPTEILK